MNERIRELAEQARIKDHWSIDEGRYLTNYLDEKKFAELIVRECLDIAKNWEDQLENANRLSESNAAGIVAYRISRQFGVKQ